MGKQMKRRQFITLLGGAAVAWPIAGRSGANGYGGSARWWALPENDPDVKAWLAGFQHALEKYGWSEGHNVRIDYRFAPAAAHVRRLAKEMVAAQPDVILS
jgi:putative ABC transport system substrate-binding protein